MEILLLQIFIPLIAALIILVSGKTFVKGIAGAFSLVSLLITICLIYSAKKTALEIVLVNDWFYAADAKIQLKYIKKVSALDKKQFIKLRGPDADPAAFNATRFWVNTGVKIELNDKKDPTPYWLVSSKKAKQLATKLN